MKIYLKTTSEMLHSPQGPIDRVREIALEAGADMVNRSLRWGSDWYSVALEGRFE